MSYELQVYALSPLRPSPEEILAKAGESGLGVEWYAVPGTSVKGMAARPTDTEWEKVLLRAAEVGRGGFLIEASPDLERMKTQFREDAATGDEIPDQVLESHRLYVLELDDEGPEGEEHQAAFVVTAWALAGLTDGIVFDPQEEFFADADSFWAIITDESLGEDGEGMDSGDDDDDEHEHGDEHGDGDGHDHAGGCCSEPKSSAPESIGIDLPSRKEGNRE